MDSRRYLGPTVLGAGLLLPVVTWVGGLAFDGMLRSFGTYLDAYLISPLFLVLSILVGVPMAVAGGMMTVTARPEHPPHHEN